MFRKLFKRQPLPPMPTTRDSLFRIAGLLGCSDYGISDDELRIVTKPLGDESDIIGGIEVKFTIGTPNLTSVAEPRMARAKYTYTTKSAGVQQELTIWDVTYYRYQQLLRRVTRMLLSGYMVNFVESSMSMN